MTGLDLWERLAATRVLPVIVLEDAATAVPVAEALISAGVPIAEVTMRTSAALEAIRAIAESGVDIAVGAGTVLNGIDVERAAEAGAQFIVSPGLSDEVVERAQDLGLPVLPGVATASEVQRALAIGLSRLKFFPAEIAGGPAALRSMRGPFPEAEFVPTGGVRPGNAVKYLAAGNVLAVGGTWIVPPESVRAGDYATILRLAREAYEALSGTSLNGAGSDTAPVRL